MVGCLAIIFFFFFLYLWVKLISVFGVFGIFIPIIVYVIFLFRDVFKRMAVYLFNAALKNKKNVIIFTSTMTCLLIVIAIISVLFGPTYNAYKVADQTYKRAISHFEQGNYLQALDSFEKVENHKKSKEKIQEIYELLYLESKRLIELEGYPKAQEYLERIVHIPEYGDNVKEMLNLTEKRIQEEERQYRTKLRETIPYKGMPENQIELSAWGKPTEIELTKNYHSLRPSHQIKYYKWRTYNSKGELKQIKTVSVREGFVWGEPRISNYITSDEKSKER
ncbi:hypothetical protein [Halalkalibacter nanhaiisediminis]|uniref:Uncharacterized protein n=1 Tax=Halalkalibacter nanhaiisediminis TaxID=688079 RepID=A0A562QMK9_9BACI|nr:hypothetical protein [Halalkalibacter nanhaiisediminis]TWI57913.1 hypothetical protein IQ10_01242 [Halalkalibacter nanhaiisediminis]